MKIVIENHIPFIAGVFDSVAQVVYLPAECITPEALRGADALITRTRTRCDRSLLEDSKCKFIATATIGTDHIDLDYCKKNGITVVSAPGCNAPAVAQYVLASIAAIVPDFEEKTLGIVGVGHVGRIVKCWAESLGMNVILNDPPRESVEGSDSFVSIDEIAERADIITFHTPHICKGQWATHHLADCHFFAKLKRIPVIINSARGPIVDTPALVHAINDKIVSAAIIDCWEGEPCISPDLLGMAAIATPHIAGYSLQGKQRATIAVVDALAAHFGIKADYAGERPRQAPDTITISALKASYNPLVDSANLKSNPRSFESLRNNYDFRLEP